MIRGGPRSARDELAMLQSRLVEMAAVVEEALRGATEALARRDTAAARAVIDGDRQVDAIELEIDEASIQLLALHQPVAGDLRLITTTMRIASDLERIGDHAVNIAEAAIRLADHQSAPEYRELVEMARLARGMVAEALDAF
ncbi:MAG TPA: phosphate signaling complex protein PhoU, partial [Longimicrobiales bacterium]|nr:phosphate signaling complex protein PhoU [Longimicrobiales bacterium]